MRLQRSLTLLAFLFSILREHYIASWRFKLISSPLYKIIPRSRLVVFTPFYHISLKLDWHVVLHTLEI